MGGAAYSTADGGFSHAARSGRCSPGKVRFLMRKTVLLLLAVMLFGSACSGTDPDATLPAQPSEPAATDPASAVEYLPVGDRPIYDPAADPAGYLHELAVWVLETGDGATLDVSDELAASSRQASECYAAKFVSVQNPSRHAAAAAALAGHGLENGFPLNIVTDAERDRLFSLAAPCLDGPWSSVLASPTPLESLGVFDAAGIAVDAATQATLESGFSDCLTTITADASNTAWLLETALFDSPDAELQLAAAELNICSEFMATALTEVFVSQGYDRDVAECIAPPMVELLVASPGLVAGFDEDAAPDPAAVEAMMAGMFPILADCDALSGLFE